MRAYIDSYLDIRSIFSLRESLKLNGLFSISSAQEDQWKKRFESYFGPLKGTHKCIEQKFKDTYEEIVRQIKNGLIEFSSLAPALKDDPYMALIAIKKDYFNVSQINLKLKLDKSFLLQAVRIDIFFYQFRQEIFNEDRDLAMAFISAFPHEYDKLPEVFKADELFINVIKIKLGYDVKFPGQNFNHVEEFDALIEPPRLQRTHAVVIEQAPNIDYSNIRFR